MRMHKMDNINYGCLLYIYGKYAYNIFQPSTVLWQSPAFTIHRTKQETLKALVHNQSVFFAYCPFSEGFD
jgi:hypothetical protein